MSLRLLEIAFVVLLVTHTAQAAGDGGGSCQCAESELINSIRSAHTLYYARITHASMPSPDAPLIDLIVEPYLVVRGHADESVELQTYTDPECGVEVRSGMPYLIVDNASNSPLTLCSTGSKQIGNRKHYLQKALHLIALESEPGGITQEGLAKIRFTGGWRHRLDVMFYYLDILGAQATVRESADRVRYGELTFNFKEKQVVSVTLD